MVGRVGGGPSTSLDQLQSKAMVVIRMWYVSK